MINPKYKEGQEVVRIESLLDIFNLSVLKIKSITTKTEGGQTKVIYSFIGNSSDGVETNLVSLDEVPKKLIEIQQEEIKKILENGLKTLEKIGKHKQEVK